MFLIDWVGNAIRAPHFSAKSCQRGFSFSINAIFFSRRQPFNCFSRSIALQTCWRNHQTQRSYVPACGARCHYTFRCTTYPSGSRRCKCSRYGPFEITLHSVILSGSVVRKSERRCSRRTPELLIQPRSVKEFSTTQIRLKCLSSSLLRNHQGVLRLRGFSRFAENLLRSG